MNTMLVFMVLCLLLGIFVKPRFRYGLALTAVLAFVLVLYFLLRPTQL